MFSSERLKGIDVFVCVADSGSFRAAAERLNLTASAISKAIARLEGRLQVQLLHRTTRQVSPTLDGAAYYQRCVRLLADLEESEGLFRGSQPKGTLRVEMPAAVGRLVVFPALPEFTGRYPQIDLEIGLNDRPVDLIREGVDCVIRGGLTVDDSLVARPLVQMDQMTCASPDYLRAHGVPQSLDDLNGHRMIEYFSSASGKRYGLEFQLGDDVRLINLPKQVSVNSAEGYLAACVAGYGLVQTPRYHVAQQVREGSLQEVLRDCLPPRLALTALYPPHRQLSPRVRVFVDWLKSSR